jgi:hypothetical protein
MRGGCPKVLLPLWGKYRRSRGRGLTGAMIQIERMFQQKALSRSFREGAGWRSPSD